MLVEFSVGNYRSFKEPVTLSMLAAKLQASDKTVDVNNVFDADGLRLLRSAAIYGANASGKSNLIQAMGFMRSFVRSSSMSQAGDAIMVEPFRLSTATLDAPSHFQVVFILNGIRYRYGFESDRQQVQAEWLYRTVQRERRLFIREGNRYEISSAFREGRGLTERTRDNALFLAVVAQFNGQLATSILTWLQTGINVVSGLNDLEYIGYTIRRFEEDAAFRQRVLALMREADLGISDVSVDRRRFSELPLSNGQRSAVHRLWEVTERLSSKSEGTDVDRVVRQVKTSHQVFDDARNPTQDMAAFDMTAQESQGTQKFFGLSGPIIDTLENGRVLVIDEMEARLHPFLTRAIIELFNSSQTNPKNAQLIFATHDTGILSSRLFRRDQIWFTEKDRYGATDLYSLAELQIRNDASFDKDYIAGRYGAVPYAGGLAALFEEETDGAEA